LGGLSGSWALKCLGRERKGGGTKEEGGKAMDDAFGTYRWSPVSWDRSSYGRDLAIGLVWGAY